MARPTMTRRVEDVAAFIRNLNVGKVHASWAYLGWACGGVSRTSIPRTRPQCQPERSRTDCSDFASTERRRLPCTRRMSRKITRKRLRRGMHDKRRSYYTTLYKTRLALSTKRRPCNNNVFWIMPALSPMYTGAAPAPVTCEQLTAIKVPVLVISQQGRGRSSATATRGSSTVCPRAPPLR